MHPLMIFLIPYITLMSCYVSGVDVKHRAAYDRVDECISLGINADRPEEHLSMANSICHNFKDMYHCLTKPFISTSDTSTKILDFYRAHQLQRILLANKENMCGEALAYSELKKLVDESGIMEKRELTNDEPADDCFTKPIGVSDQAKIPDNDITASSLHGVVYLPAYGRLNGERGHGWCAKEANRSDDWLQVDLGTLFSVCGVATQGDRDGNEGVTAFTLSYSTDGDSWKIPRDPGLWAKEEFHREKPFLDDVDQHKLLRPVSARYFRFHPTEQQGWNCLRVEIYGEKGGVWDIPCKGEINLDCFDLESRYWATQPNGDSLMQDAIQNCYELESKKKGTCTYSRESHGMGFIFGYDQYLVCESKRRMEEKVASGTLGEHEEEWLLLKIKDVEEMCKINDTTISFLY